MFFFSQIIVFPSGVDGTGTAWIFNCQTRTIESSKSLKRGDCFTDEWRQGGNSCNVPWEVQDAGGHQQIAGWEDTGQTGLYQRRTEEHGCYVSLKKDISRVHDDQNQELLSEFSRIIFW